MQEAQKEIKSAPLLCGNTNTGLLKLIAVIAMILDHAGAALFPGCQELRLIGRIAFPLFVWCLVVGTQYTRSFPKYALRLLLLLIISQPFYMLALSHTWQELNIFATLLLGLCAIYGIRAKKYYSHLWAPALAVLVACFVTIDYGWKGVLFILLVYGARKTKSGLAALMVAFCLFWGQTSANVRTLFGLPLAELLNLQLFQNFLRVQTFALLSLPLMLIPFGKKLRVPKWLAYSAYPAHLLVIYLIKLWM